MAFPSKWYNGHAATTPQVTMLGKSGNSNIDKEIIPSNQISRHENEVLRIWADYDKGYLDVCRSNFKAGCSLDKIPQIPITYGLFGWTYSRSRARFIEIETKQIIPIASLDFGNLEVAALIPPKMKKKFGATYTINNYHGVYRSMFFHHNPHRAIIAERSSMAMSIYLAALEWVLKYE